VDGSLGQRIAGQVISSINNALRSVSFSFAMHDRLVVLIGLISLIPVIGSLVSLAIFILGVGAALATRFGATKYRSAEQVLTDSED